MNVSDLATRSNIDLYNSMNLKNYLDGAPHLKHRKLRDAYFNTSKKVLLDSNITVPTVLDLGAGEGTATYYYLSQGAKVVAVDISQNQLSVLKDRCAQYSDNLSIICEDINDTVKRNDKFDIVIINSLLHHIPDFCKLLDEVSNMLNPGGQIFTWQDPLRYDSLNRFTLLFSNFTYFAWRIRKGDVIQGIKRRLKRSRGIYSDDLYDNSEYHVVRNGVDQDSIVELFKAKGFEFTLIKYFSTQSGFWQYLGELLHFKNTFGIIVKKVNK